MDPKQTERSQLAVSADRFIQVAVLFCVAVGTCIVAAWFAGWPILTRLISGAPGMVLDTAICILLIAAGLWFAQRRMVAPVRLIAAILMPAGAVNFFIRNAQIALHSHVLPHGADGRAFPTPPQMSQGTASAVLLAGIGLLLLGRARPSMAALRVTALLGTAVASLGIITLLAYAAGLYATPAWNGTFLFQLAIPTAITCCVIGSALIAFFWKEDMGPRRLSVTAAMLSIVCLLFMVGTVDASVWAISSAIMDSRAAARSASDELSGIQALVDSVRAAETSQRGYLLTGDEQYRRAMSVAQQQFEEISRNHKVHDAKLLVTARLRLEQLQRAITLEEQGKHAEAIRPVESEPGTRLMEQIDQQAATVASTWRNEREIRRDESARSVASLRKTILWSYAMVILLAGCALYLIGMEIRRRSQIEEDLRNSELSLESINSKLREETARAREASHTKSSFLASMSHEIRTPMTAILGIADLLWESELSQTQRHYVEVFRRAGGNLLTLINGLLDLSKIESGSFELETTEFDVRAIVEQVIETLTPKAETKGLCLAASIASTTTTNVVGDPARLQQVLFNLIGNAIKFTEQGEVVLRVSSHASDTHVSLEFEVSDTGIGIAADQLPKIFDEFKQAEASTNRRFGGTGLGLGISRSLVGFMGGDIQVTSELGKGSTFRFNVVLPIGVQPETAALLQLEQIGRKKVLVVDDTAINRAVLSEMLAALGIAATTCGSGAEAIELATAKETQPFDLVLIDKVMPGMGGLETASKIKRLRPETAIFIISSDSKDGEIRRFRDLGLSGLLMKPVRRSELERIVRALGAPPQAAAPPDISPIEAKKPEHSKKRARILVAEDSEDNRFLLEAYCQESDYQITFAEDGEQAVAAFRSGTFEAIVMDVQMPVMDGLTAARQIRLIEADRGSQRVPMLALTANALQDDVMRSVQAGCDTHLVKPISKQTFLTALGQWQSYPVA